MRFIARTVHACWLVFQLGYHRGEYFVFLLSEEAFVVAFTVTITSFAKLGKLMAPWCFSAGLGFARLWF